jgi:hypothetical protein
MPNETGVKSRLGITTDTLPANPYLDHLRPIRLRTYILNLKIKPYIQKSLFECASQLYSTSP